MANIIKETTEIIPSIAYYYDEKNEKVGEMAFYEKIIKHFVWYDDDTIGVSITTKKISKKTYEKLQKTLDKSNQM